MDCVGDSMTRLANPLLLWLHSITSSRAFLRKSTLPARLFAFGALSGRFIAQVQRDATSRAVLPAAQRIVSVMAVRIACRQRLRRSAFGGAEAHRVERQRKSKIARSKAHGWCLFDDAVA